MTEEQEKKVSVFFRAPLFSQLRAFLCRDHHHHQIIHWNIISIRQTDRHSKGQILTKGNLRIKRSVEKILSRAVIVFEQEKKFPWDLQRLMRYPWITLRSIKGHYQSQSIFANVLVTYINSISNYENGILIINDLIVTSILFCDFMHLNRHWRLRVELSEGWVQQFRFHKRNSGVMEQKLTPLLNCDTLWEQLLPGDKE